MAGGGYFGDKYFPEGFFPEGYFGTTGEADPNAMFGSAAGLATVTGLLTNGSVGFIIGLAQGIATVSGDLTFTGEAEEQVGGAQFGPIHKLRRKKKTAEKKVKRVTDAVREALDEIEAQAARAKIATVKQAEKTVDSEMLIKAAGDAAFKATYEAGIQQKIDIERIAAEHLAVLQAELAKAKAEANAAYQRFIDLKAQNDDDEEALFVILNLVEAA
jgi:hypothetical protein